MLRRVPLTRMRGGEPTLTCRSDPSGLREDAEEAIEPFVAHGPFIGRLSAVLKAHRTTVGAVELRRSRWPPTGSTSPTSAPARADAPLALCRQLPRLGLDLARLAALADAGFRVVAPFLRGYALRGHLLPAGRCRLPRCPRSSRRYAPTAVPDDGRCQTGCPGRRRSPRACDWGARAADGRGGPDRATTGGPARLRGRRGTGPTGGRRCRRLRPLKPRPARSCTWPPPSSPTTRSSAASTCSSSRPRSSTRPWPWTTWPSSTALAPLRPWPGYEAMEDLAYTQPVPADRRQPGRRPGLLPGHVRWRATTHLDLAAEQAATVSPTPQPTLYLHGADRRLHRVWRWPRGAETFLGPGCRAEVVAGAGHFLHLERPEVVDAASSSSSP